MWSLLPRAGCDWWRSYPFRGERQRAHAVTQSARPRRYMVGLRPIASVRLGDSIDAVSPSTLPAAGGKCTGGAPGSDIEANEFGCKLIHLRGGVTHSSAVTRDTQLGRYA